MSSFLKQIKEKGIEMGFLFFYCAGEKGKTVESILLYF
jgi:hypothetical protein